MTRPERVSGHDAQPRVAMVAFPAPTLPGQACPVCDGEGVTGERYRRPPTSDGGVPLLVDVLCPRCGGCGRREHDDETCTAVEHAGAGPDPGAGRVGGADDVPPAPRWAGRFIAARSAGDRQQCDALLQVLAGLDGDRFAEHVVAVIESCAAAVRAAGPCRCGRCRS